MQKMTKKLILLLLAIVIAAAAPLTATAEPEAPAIDVSTAPARIAGMQTEPSDNSMETALIAAKSLIDIDDDVFTEFSYSSSFSNYETMEGLLWSFNWSSLEGAGYIFATVTADGVLLSFWKYNWEGKNFGFANIDKSAAIAKADEFIKKANPDSYTYYKTPTDVQTDIGRNDYSINYYAEINGYHFETAHIGVRINKFTGEVVGYYTNRVDPRKFSFEDSTGIIAESAAVTAYADKIGLSLEYKSCYDYESGKMKVFPVYLQNSYNDIYIGAKTGDVVYYVYDAGVEDSFTANTKGEALMAAEEPMADAEYGGSSVRLTPSETSAIEQAASFITSEQALQKLLEAAELTDMDVESFDDKYISLNRDWYSKTRYSYEINLYKYYDYDRADNEITNVYGCVDATTGRVTSFSFYYNGYPSDNQKIIAEAQIEQIVNAFLRKMAPAELAKSKLDYGIYVEAIPYSSRGGYHDFNYIRYENNIPFKDNRIGVTVNAYTGKITGYSLHWYDDISFPGIGNVLSPVRALAEYVGQNGSKICYVTIGEGKVALVYDFRSEGKGQYIDPNTGKALDYTGELWIDSSMTPDYSDVKGHWSERYVTKLRDNGVFMWGGKFEPEKIMTELDFLQYLMLSEPYSYIDRSETKAYFAQHGVNVEASPDKLLTRQEAVRIIVEYLGYGKLAEQSEWFVYPFSDKVAEEYKGYITICYMLGIINGDAGRFNAANNVTRAHAAAMLHNLIIAKS